MLTADDKQEIIRLRNVEHWSLPAIGKKFNIHHTTVIYHLQHPDKIIQIRGRQTRRGPTEYIEREYKRIVEKQSGLECIRDEHGKSIGIVKVEGKKWNYVKDRFMFKNIKGKKDEGLTIKDDDEMETEVDVSSILSDLGVNPLDQE